VELELSLPTLPYLKGMLPNMNMLEPQAKVPAIVIS
jgi:hypothetical protein